MGESELFEVAVDTSDPTGLAVSLLLENTAQAIQETDGTETARFSLSLEIQEQ